MPGSGLMVFIAARTAAKHGVIMREVFAELLHDERGGEVMEYALIAGLIIVGAIACISAVGQKALARWSSMNDSL